MRILSTITLVALLAIPSAATLADGLIYRLPKDGTSVEFEMKESFERNGQKMESDGTFSMSFAGKETVDGEACRWIEFKMVMKLGGNVQTIVAKVLVPEKQLAAGKHPFSHVKKAWLKQGDREAKELSDDELSGNDGGPLPAFLAGPFDDAKTPKSETIDSGLGKLEIKVVTGSTQFKQGLMDNKYTFTNRLNDKAPFGVVASEIKFELTQNDQQVNSGTMTFKLAKVGKDAMKGIPNNK